MLGWILAAMVGILLFSTLSMAAGDRFVFIRDGNVWMAGTRGGAEKQITFTGKDRNPTISRDGKWIAYASGAHESTGLGQLYLAATSGGTPKKFSIRNIHSADYPSFSPDGNSILFVGVWNVRVQGAGDDTLTTASIGIFTIDLVSFKAHLIIGQADVILDFGMIYVAPRFSPDGKMIVYQEGGSDVSGGFEVIDLSGRGLFRYPRHQNDPTPYWSPHFNGDGSQVLCSSPMSSESGVGNIYLVPIQKGHKKKIAEGVNPAFVSQGKAILFERHSGRQGTGKPDIWYMDLSTGAVPKRIILNGSNPAGQPFLKQLRQPHTDGAMMSNIPIRPAP